MSWPTDRQAWFDCEDDLQSAVVRIIAGTDVKYTENGLNDPVIYAATLLFRTLSSVRAVFILASKGFLVESNMIARSCVENVLWLRGLNARGMEFVQDILRDTMRADASLAQLITSMPGVVLDAEATELAAAQIRRKNKTRIDLQKVSKATAAARMDYSVFRLISHNFAHPSLKSLDMYLERNPEDGAYSLRVEPEASPRDLLWTMFIAAGAALTAVGEFLGTFPAEQQTVFDERGYVRTLQEYADRFRELGSREGLSGTSPAWMRVSPA